MIASLLSPASHFRSIRLDDCHCRWEYHPSYASNLPPSGEGNPPSARDVWLFAVDWLGRHGTGRSLEGTVGDDKNKKGWAFVIACYRDQQN